MAAWQQRLRSQDEAAATLTRERNAQDRREFMITRRVETLTGQGFVAIKDDAPPVLPPDDSVPFQCCLYPNPAALGFPYPSSDLPTTLLVKGDIGDGQGGTLQEEVTLIRPYVYQGQRYIICGDGSLQGTNDSTQWVLGHTLDNDGKFNPYGIYDAKCLVGSGFAFGNVVQDYFADTYHVTDPTGAISVVTRQDLCTWTGAGYTLQYQGGLQGDLSHSYSFSGPFKWLLSGRKNLGSQSSPVGTYEDSYSVTT